MRPACQWLPLEDGQAGDVATFSPNANGVGVDEGKPLIARTPLASRLNVSHHAARSLYNMHFKARSRFKVVLPDLPSPEILRAPRCHSA